MSWPAPDKSVEFRYEGSLDAEGRFGLLDSRASTTQWLGQEYCCEEIPDEVKWSADSSMVWVRTGGDPGDPLNLFCHRQDLSTGVRYLEDISLKLPDHKSLIMRYGDEAPEPLLIGHTERVKAFVMDEYMGQSFDQFAFEMHPLMLPSKDGLFSITLQYNSRFNGWPHYKLWISSADRVHFQAEKIVRVQNYFRNMVREKKKNGTLYDRAAGLGNPEIPLKLTPFEPSSPDGKWHLSVQETPKRKDGRVALFLGYYHQQEKAVPILPEEVFENPKIQWAKNSCCALLTEGPVDNRLTRLLVLRKDAISRAVYFEERVPRMEDLINYNPPFNIDLTTGKPVEPANLRCQILSFTKSDLYDGASSDGESRRMDRNLGVIFELQSAEKDAKTGMMKVKEGAPVYRITQHSPDWLRYAFREVVKIEGDQRTILYKDDKAEPR